MLLRWFLGCVVGLMSCMTWALEPLRVAYVEFPPFEYTNAQGQPAGSFLDITRKVLAEAGYAPEFIALPISRIYLYLQEGQVDLWPGVTGVPALEGYVLESRARPVRIHLKIWHLDSTPPVENLNDLKGKRLILITGFTYGGLAYKLTPENGYNVTTTTSHASALKMLKIGRGDYLLDYSDPVYEVMKQEPVDNLRSVPVRERTAAFLISRKNPLAEEILRRVDAAYERLIENGVIKPLEGH